MAQSRDAVLAALSDVVTVDSNNSNSNMYNQYSSDKGPPLPDKNSNSNLGMGARLAGAFRKAAGHDKESKRREKAARMKEEIDKSTAKSSRMDIIDRWDSTGIHGSSMFHHDSPYDAVSPHRNRHAQKAPVKAFDPNVDPMTGKKKVNGTGGGVKAASSPLSKGNQNQRPSISSRATGGSAPNYSSPSLPILNSDGTTTNNNGMSYPNESSISFNNQQQHYGSGSRTPSSSQIPGVNDGRETDSMTSASIPPSEAGDDDRGYYNTPSNQAEIWGVASEPWQDFASPKVSSKDKNKRSSKAGGKPGYNSNNLAPHARQSSFDNNRSGISSSASSVMDMEAILTGKTSEQRKAEEADMRRRADNDGENLVGSGVSPFPERDWSAFKDEDNSGTGGVKRNKSLIKRIKSARQSPNVPPPDSVDDVELSSISNNSNGNERRYGPGSARRQHKYSPSTPPLATGLEGSSSLAINVESNTPDGPGSGTGNDPYAFQGYGNSNNSSNSRVDRNRNGIGGSMRIRTRNLSPESPDYGTGNNPSPGGEAITPTGTQGADYLNVKGEDDRRGRSNSGNSNTSAAGGQQGLGRSGSLFGRFGRKGKAAGK